MLLWEIMRIRLKTVMSSFPVALFNWRNSATNILIMSTMEMGRVYFYIKPEIPKSVGRLVGKFVLEVLNREEQPWKTLNGHWKGDWVDLMKENATDFEKYYHLLFESTGNIFITWNRNDHLDSDENLNLRITFNLMAPHTLKHPDEKMIKSRVAEIFGVAWASDMEHLLNDPSDADFRIKTSDDVEFPVHKLILKTRVPMFRTMFAMGNWRETNTNVMETPTISSGAMKILLYFIYTGKLHDDWRIWRSSLIEVLDGAKQNELDGLVAYYDHLLITLCNDMDTEDLLKVATRYDLKQAEDDIKSFKRSLETNDSLNDMS